MVANWRNHASAVSSVVNTIGGSHLQRLAAGYQALANAVNRALQNANANWARHRSAVASAVSSSVSAVSRLASATSSAMNRVASAMRTATSAANNLRSAISRLQSRTITVTTRYRTIGSPAGGVRRAAKGFDGIVTQPTTFLTGEGGRPEHVQVTPLSPNASGNVKMNRAAATSGMRAQFGGPIAGKPMVRAGGSKSNASQRADSVVIMPGGRIMIFTAGGTLKEAPWMKKGGNWLDWLGKSKKQLNKLRGLAGSEVLKPTLPKGRVHTTKDPFRDKAISSFDVTGSRTQSRVDPLKRGVGAPGAVRGRGGKSLFDLGVATRHGEKMQAWVVKEQRFADGSYIRQFNNGAIVFGRDTFKTPESGASATASKKSPTGSFIKVFQDGTWRKFNSKGRTIKSGTHKFTGSKYEYRGDQLYKNGKQFTPKINARKGFSGMVSRPTSFTVGEGGRPEYVNVQPTSGGGGGGRGSGRPIMVKQYISLEVDKKVIAKAIRSEMLGGIYSMA
jgi:hypothetical protein